MKYEWTKELDIELDRLVETMGTQWSSIAKAFPIRNLTPYELRTRWRSTEHRDHVREHYRLVTHDIEANDYPQEQEFLSNGNIKLVKEIKLKGNRVNDLLTPEELMEAHGIDYNMFDLVSAKSNNWQMLARRSGGSEPVTLFQSSITVRPKKRFVNWDMVSQHISERIEPIDVMPKCVKDGNGRNLIIHLTDLHFGRASMDTFMNYLRELDEILDSRNYDEILIALTGDILNEDNYNGTTASGTQIGRTDMTQGWLDAFDFLESIICRSLMVSAKVKVSYVAGNHDLFSGHTIVLGLMRRFDMEDNLEFDFEQSTFKVSMLGNIMVGLAHGDRSKLSDYPSIFSSRFPKEWGRATRRECLVGHKHHAKVIQEAIGGMTIRQSPTATPMDEWHDFNGFSSEKEMVVYECDTDKIRTTYNI